MSSRRRKKYIETDSESSFDLDLAPMLALMVTLIPIMLLSTVFVQVTVIDTKLPQVVENAIQEDRAKKDRVVLVELNIHNKSGFALKITQDGRPLHEVNIPKNAGEWNLQKLQVELVKAKHQHPKIFRLDLKPEQSVSYSDIVKVIDEARTIKDETQKIQIKDSKSKELVTTDVLYPDVVFADVVEG